MQLGPEMKSSRVIGSALTSGGIETSRMSVTKFRCRLHVKHLSVLVLSGRLEPLTGLASKLHDAALKMV